MENVLRLVIHVLDDNTAAGSRLIDNHRFRLLRLRCGDLLLRLISPRELAHESVTAVIREIDARDIIVVERASSTRFVAAGAVEVAGTAGVGAAAAGAREGRSLELCLLSLRAKSVQQRLRGL